MGRHGKQSIQLPAHLIKGLSLLNGIFGVKKPEGESSARTVERVKRRLIELLLTSEGIINNQSSSLTSHTHTHTHTHTHAHAQTRSTGHLARELGRRLKVGHGGTLDPIATGVLVIGLGEGCKRLSAFLGSVTKTYRATGRLGQAYDTFDRTGVVMREVPWEGRVTEEMISELLRERFIGIIKQRPPLFSALRINGERAYAVARKQQKEHLASKAVLDGELKSDTGDRGGRVQDQDQDPDQNCIEKGTVNNKDGDEEQTQQQAGDSPGETIQLAERTITIHRIQLLSCDLPEFVLEMECSSGTYVRSLIHDLGEALGTTAAMWQLERTAQGSVNLDDCLAVEDIDSIDMLRAHLK